MMYSMPMELGKENRTAYIFVHSPAGFGLGRIAVDLAGLLAKDAGCPRRRC